MNTKIEHCWLIEGRKLPFGFLGKLRYLGSGQTHEVQFGWSEICDQEDQLGNVIGFLHTHPNTNARPSQTDLATMNAWVSAFGKSLICGIDGVDGLKSFLFSPNEAEPTPVECIRIEQRFMTSNPNYQEE